MYMGRQPNHNGSGDFLGRTGSNSSERLGPAFLDESRIQARAELNKRRDGHFPSVTNDFQVSNPLLSSFPPGPVRAPVKGTKRNASADHMIMIDRDANVSNLW